MIAPRVVRFKMTPAHAILIFGLIGIVYSKYAYIDEFKTVVFDKSTISLQTDVVNRTFFNINLTVHQIHNVKILCGLKVKRLTNDKMKNIFSLSHIELCKFLDTFESNKFFNALFKRIFTGTYLKSCPLKKGVYYIKHAYFDDNLIGMILPRGKYLIRIDASLLIDGIVKLMSSHIKFTLA